MKKLILALCAAALCGCDSKNETPEPEKAPVEEQTPVAAPEPVAQVEEIVIDGPALPPAEENPPAPEEPPAPPPPEEPKMVVPYDPATIVEGVQAGAAMGYAALDGSGEFRGEMHRTGPVGEQVEWFAAGGGAYTNAAGQSVTQAQYNEMGRVAMGDASSVMLSDIAKPRPAADEAYIAIVKAYCGVAKITDLKPTHDWTKEGLLVPKGAEHGYTVRDFGGGLYELQDWGPAGGDRTYAYFYREGGLCREAAAFAFEPDSEAMAKSLVEARSNPAAMNNLAAMVFNGIAKSDPARRAAAERLLAMAAAAGEPMAARNLAILYSGAGDGAAAKRRYYLDEAAHAAAAPRTAPPAAPAPVKLERWPAMR